jgi:LPS-assembly lipoprotein
MRSIRTIALLTLLAALALSGCGFQLRGATEVPAELSPMFVQAPRGYFTAAALKSTLYANGVALAASAGDARTVIRILREEEDERVTAVNSQGKVIGTELQLRVEFDAVGKGARPLAERQVIQLAREYVNPGVEVIGKTEEALLIRQDMRDDMADRILHRLKAQLLNP